MCIYPDRRINNPLQIICSASPVPSCTITGCVSYIHWRGKHYKINYQQVFWQMCYILGKKSTTISMILRILDPIANIGKRGRYCVWLLCLHWAAWTPLSSYDPIAGLCSFRMKLCHICHGASRAESDVSQNTGNDTNELVRIYHPPMS